MKQGYSADPEALFDTTAVGTLEDQRKMTTPAAPRENNKSQHRTLKNATLLEHRRGENGAYRIPYPQRDRGDGLAYTKRVRTSFSVVRLSLTLIAAYSFLDRKTAWSLQYWYLCNAITNPYYCLSSLKLNGFAAFTDIYGSALAQA